MSEYPIAPPPKKKKKKKIISTINTLTLPLSVHNWGVSLHLEKLSNLSMFLNMLALIVIFDARVFHQYE